MRRSPRVLLAGVGPERDPAEAVGMARALRDVGWEVVHLGEVPSAEVVAAVARDEDADAVVVFALGATDAAGLVTGVTSALAHLGAAGVSVVDGGEGAASVVAALGSAVAPGDTTAPD